tara:strand:+ start:569 stop:1579 length:1011 start_codon:yes stop_codon:yes gene_type:complete
MKQKKNKKINAATIGLGFGLTHALTFKKNKLVNLVNITDTNKKKKIYEKKLKTKFVKNENLIFSNKKINLVSIASYDNYHYKQIIKAIKFKKNIFVEKPICQNLNQLKQIKRLLDINRLKLSSNFVLRYHPKFKKVMEIITKKTIGKIYSIEGEYNYGRLKKITKGWRGKIPFYSVVQGGGIHIIDLMNWFTNSFPVKAISAANKMITKNSKFRFNDNNIAILKFDNGVIGKVTSNFSCVIPHHHFFKIFGSKGSLTIGSDYIYLYKDTKKNSKPKKIKYKFDKNYKEKLLDNYINQLKKNHKIINPSLKEIFYSMATCFAVDRSLKTNKWEEVKI